MKRDIKVMDNLNKHSHEYISTFTPLSENEMELFSLAFFSVRLG